MIKYPYLPADRTIKYVDASNQYMLAAEKAAKELSTDTLQSTGAVVVKDGKIIGRGANQSRLKNKKLFELHLRGFCLRKKLKIPSGQYYWLCPGCSPCHNHGEQQAVRNALKNADTNGADLYLWGHWWCCEPCWNKMIKEGIKDVYLLNGSEELFNVKSPNHIIGKK